MKPVSVLAAAGMLAAFACAAFAERDPDFEPIRTSPPKPDRYQAFHDLAARGPQMSVAVATPFGGKGYEEFIGGAVLADGSTVAAGNAWGPEFPATPAPVILGHGKHLGLPAVDAKGTLRDDDPDIAGMLVVYDAALTKVQQVVRFDWGVATITAVAAASDGKGILLAGRATEAFRGLAQTAGICTVQVDSGRKGGYLYEKTPCTGDIYVARFDLASQRLEWAYVLAGAGKAPTTFWLDKTGAAYFDAGGLMKVSADGRGLFPLSRLTSSGTAKWLGIDPADGSAFFGGDRNTHTHKEPWRQPYLYRFDAMGTKVWTLWEAKPADVGSDRNGLESDSGVRNLAINSKGELIVSGWSDGANSVFPRQALDFHKYAPEGGFGMTPWWPHGAMSISHLMRIDGKTLETKSHQWWVGYTPMNFGDKVAQNRPASTNIARLAVLGDDAVAITGGAATGLIQTPNAFWKDPRQGERYGGTYLAVLNADMSALRFSSYLPGCTDMALIPTKDGLLAVGRTIADDGNAVPTPTPSVKALQAFGGATDGALILLKNPAQ